jgi:uncharacterized cupredoxin-like copper-binding protein
MTLTLRFAPLAIAAVAAVASPQTPRRAVTHEVTIVARDYAFDAPDSVPAGVITFHLVNHGTDLHHVVLIRLDAGHTAQDFVAAFGTAMSTNGPLPDWAAFFGGPNPPAPGMEATATLALQPGHYLVTCLVPSPDGVSHIMKGMVRPLTVTGAKSTDPLPAAGVTMTLVDYGFQLSRPLVAGRQTIRVRNAAAQRHEVLLLRLAPNRSISDLPAWVDTRNGPPPGLPLGGVSPIAPGVEANITVDLIPGEYGLICFVSDATDGKPHFMHGMMHQFTVAPARVASVSAR